MIIKFHFLPNLVLQFVQLVSSGKVIICLFQFSQTVYTKLLQLVVLDLWGPAPINSSYGFTYYVSFADAYSRYTWVYFLKTKSQTREAFLMFKAQAELQFGCKLKTFQTDWGGEFRSLKTYFEQNGIIHRLSCPHTSKQNDIIERKHRHIVELGLTVLAQASLPLKY